VSKVPLIEQIADLNLRIVEITDTIKLGRKAGKVPEAVLNIRESRLQKLKAAAKTLEWLYDNEQTIRDAVQGRAA
jgi:hypothetical protein